MNRPLPGQCEGLPPIMEPAAIPSDASFQGTLKINGVTASQWDYLDDGLQQVVSVRVYVNQRIRAHAHTHAHTRTHTHAHAHTIR